MKKFNIHKMTFKLKNIYNVIYMFDNLFIHFQTKPITFFQHMMSSIHIFLGGPLCDLFVCTL